MDSEKIGSAESARDPQNTDPQPNPTAILSHSGNSLPQNKKADEKQCSAKHRQKPILLIRTWRKIFRKDPKTPRANWAEKVGMLTAIVIAFAAVLQLLVYIQMKGIMQSSGGQTDKLITAADTQAGAASNVATSAKDFSVTSEKVNSTIGKAEKDFERMAKAAEQSAIQAKTTLDLARSEQRAWISAGAAVRAPPTVGQILEVKVTTANTGKTPAVNTKSCGAITIQTMPSIPKINCTSENSRIIGILSPNAPWAYADTAPFGERPLTQEEYNGIVSEKLYVFQQGKITYDDVFGRNHWVTYCYRLFSTGAFGYCDTGNDIDK